MPPIYAETSYLELVETQYASLFSEVAGNGSDDILDALPSVFNSLLVDALVDVDHECMKMNTPLAQSSSVWWQCIIK